MTLLGRVALASIFLGGCAGGGAGVGDGASAAWDPEGSSDGGDVEGSRGDTSSVPASDGGGETTAAPSADADTTGAATPDLPPADDCPRVRVAVTPGNTLNVRPDPSTAGEPVGALPNNAVVDKLDEVVGEAVDGNTQWFEIQLGDVHGYVSGVFATCTLDDPPELLPPDGFYIPLACGYQTTIAQGNDGGFSHQGTAFYAFDFSVPIETPLMAMADGIVAYTFADTGPGDPCYNGGGPECFAYGNLVVLLHGDGTTSLYKHLNRVDVAVGEFVPHGHTVGLSGSTGYSTGPHAHIMRMEDCGMAQCQSIPLEFVEAGVPNTGDEVTSANCPDP